MNRQTSISLLNDTFNAEFDTGRFTRFVKELFNEFEIERKTWTVWKEYQDYIESYELIGNYTSGKKSIDVLTVKLKKNNSLDRARTMQRNFIAKYLANAEKETALVAFYDDSPDWRFSFIKMEYNLVKDDSGKVKVAKELTPAKRYSFLVGINEPNHTCRSQFLSIVMEDSVNPTIDEIESAFGIEKVTKEFFEKYKELFHRVKESLDKETKNNERTRKEFENKNISSVDFAKKLLGQIVFIYFLQKKGWLGVARYTNGGFKSWGSGPKNFMRKLFDKEIVEYDNFFNDILEPLFYEALATPRDDDFYSRFNCKIPFLNGGLFEPINEYDWAGTDIYLDNDIFDRILRTFDEFNFTVKEDEPLEKEVAVDPEMLGKVFENLLEVTDRKSKGAFYTPREIVHYMCQQSLINYLETNTDIKREDIEKFIKLGDLALAQIIKEQEQVKKYGRSYEQNQMYSIPKKIKENYKQIDSLLKNIKIVDPAVGSGAFPVGMMNEVVKSRSILSIFSTDEIKLYDLKRQTIENSLYGVDVELSAVDITKLRFWLSLIVDELDMKNIKPLPNLDHKIMCGNSLLEEFEGVKLFDEKLLGLTPRDYSFEIKEINRKIKALYDEGRDYALGKKSDPERDKKIGLEIKKLERQKHKLTNSSIDTSRQATLDEAVTKKIKESQIRLSRLKELQRSFFNESNRKLKKEYKEKIEQIEWEFVEETLKEQGNDEALEKLQQYKKNKSKPFFLWKLYFSDVFQRENPGFDVVIANPPYVRQEEIKDIKTQLQQEYHVFSSRADLYTYFYEKSLRILREEGCLTFISSNKFMRAMYGDKLRDYLKFNTRITSIVDFGSVHMFEAITNTLVVVLKKGLPEDNVFSYSNDINGHETTYTDYIQSDLKKESWTLAQRECLDIMKKMESKGKELVKWDVKISYGIKTGYNEAYVIERDIKEKLIKKNPKIKNIIKPLLRGRDIKKYYTEFADKWIIIVEYGQHEEISNDYPEVVEYLSSYKDRLQARGQVTNGQHHWLELDNNPTKSYIDLFAEEKIIWIELSDKNKFCYSKNNEFILAGAFMLTGEKLKYLLAFFNSKLCLFYFKLICNSSGMNTIQWKKFAMEKIPIVYPDSESEIKSLVDDIMSITSDEDYSNNLDKQQKVHRIEKQINKYFYNIYGLNSEEIEFIENFNN